MYATNVPEQFQSMELAIRTMILASGCYIKFDKEDADVEKLKQQNLIEIEAWYFEGSGGANKTKTAE